MDRLEKALEKSRQMRAAMETELKLAFNMDTQQTRKDPRLLISSEFTEPLDEAQMERSRIVAHLAYSSESDVYRRLRTKVLQIMNLAGFKTLAITSPQYGDGKTTVALNLGISIARDIKQTVLLVDLDLRKPSLHQYLGVKTHAGLTDYLLNDTPLHECLLRPPFERLNTLPAGTALNNSSELLGSPQMTMLARELKSRYPDRIVIYDMPPALTQDDTIAFLPRVDAVLVVVRDGVTRAENLKRCLQTLSGANVIGTVLNNCW